MDFTEFRGHFETFRERADAEAAAAKDSYLALERLRELYRKLDARERLMADQLLAEWSMSENECIRFDALALVHDFRIVKALPGLQALRARLLGSPAIGAAYELKKVDRLIRLLKEAEA